MAGRGKGGGRGRGGGGPSSKSGTRAGLRTSFVASTHDGCLDARQGNAFTQSHFSLNEEARNTERHYSANPDLKLRHSRITFISAGTSTAERLKPVMLKSKSSGELTESQFQVMSEAPVKVSDSRPPAHAVIPDAEMSSMTLDNLRSAPIPQVDLVQGLDSMFKRSNTDRGLAGPEVRNEVPSSKFRDTDEPMNTDSVTPSTRRSPSPTHSDSSREVIIFAGRHQSCNKGIQKQTSDIPSQNLTTQKISRFSGQPRPMTAVRDDPIDVKAHRIQILPKRRPSSQKALDYFDCHSRPTATLRSNRERRRRHIGIEMKDEGILDDYVANLRDGSDLEAFIESSVLAQRDLGGSDTIEWQDEVEYPPTMRVESGPMRESEQWDSADMEDFDELSTSDEVLESIEQILSKRERPSGVQYLVIGAGGTVDDARWLPVSSLNDQRARQLIREFENTESDHLLDGSHLTDASLAINEQIAQDLQEDLDDKEDENDLEERRMARMTDERVARLLSKQEELGLGSEDLILLDGRELVTDSQEELRPDGLWVRPVTHLKPSKTKTTKQSRFKTPSTTTFADTLDQDPYNGFDVMDQHRPSLRKRPKGRRGKHSLELSDSELEQSLYAAWEKDRSKKKVRKQEREELRAQGLLGKKNKTDLKVKYSQGISMAEVKKEIRDFLLSSMESLPLPPMARGDRKIVHEIANVFKLKSKSTGNGKSRFPVLYRTSRTIQHSEETLKAVEPLQSSGRFLPRMDRAKRKGALIGRGRRSEAASAGVSYRDGEVVGAAAPEIGLENRGRTMLERMGWSTGTALGALNNSRGLVQPVTQVVKTSRSGLG